MSSRLRKNKKHLVEHAKKQVLVAIVGPTASGKSSLAVDIAKRVGGEIVSADSRQIYRELNLSSGKVTKQEMGNVRHHLLDIASVRRTISAAQYRVKALKAIHDIWKRGNIPILCGGTGFYVQAIIDGLMFPNVKPNSKLRRSLGGKATYVLFKMLALKDPRRAKEIDRHNRHRLIRALEILDKQEYIKPVQKKPLDAHILIIGIQKSQMELKKLIHKRLLQRIKVGMVDEIRILHESGVRWERLESLGLEFKFTARFLQNKLTNEEYLRELEKAIEHYAKRQMTWFKRDKRIHWIKNESEVFGLVREFLA